MYLRDEGLVWERTEKTDANHELVRSTRGRRPAAARPRPAAVEDPLPAAEQIAAWGAAARNVPAAARAMMVPPDFANVVELRDFVKEERNV
jgi:hypothetical protein